MILVFLVCMSLVGYSYLIYPFILQLLTKCFHKRQYPSHHEHNERLCDDQLPSVSVVVSAYNEEAVIGERISNLIGLNYPPNKLEIIIASDGSTDRTCAIAEEFLSYPQVRLLRFETNRGKAATINEAIALSLGEVLVLSDANTKFDKDAVTFLVEALTLDRSTVAVCGKLRLIDQNGSQNVDGIYWRYENWIKTNESRIGALLGANGAIYAVRSDQYVPIPNNTIVDDFTIPLLIKLRHGGHIVYEEKAIATEKTPENIGDEFSRRIRIGVGAYQSLGLLWPLLLPRYGVTALAFFSHKVLRWITPFLMLLMAMLVLIGISAPFFQVVLLLTCALLLGVALDSVIGKNGGSKLGRILSMFVKMNAALFVGFVKWLTTTQTGTWSRTKR